MHIFISFKEGYNHQLKLMEIEIYVYTYTYVYAYSLLRIA